MTTYRRNVFESETVPPNEMIITTCLTVPRYRMWLEFLDMSLVSDREFDRMMENIEYHSMGCHNTSCYSREWITNTPAPKASMMRVNQSCDRLDKILDSIENRMSCG